MKTIYKTIGAAKEYCDYAVDIYENCPHQCSYCYEKDKAEKNGKAFEFGGERSGVLAATEEYLMTHDMSGKMIFLGFSSDCLAVDIDLKPTLNMTRLLKRYGCKIMICTKGKLTEDVKEILKYVDSVGITLTCGEDMACKYEKNAASVAKRMELLIYAKSIGKETWISFEPVLDKDFIYSLLTSDFMSYIDTAKFGKLNHMEISDLTDHKEDNIDWAEYGRTVISICKEHNINYKIKEALSKFM